MGFGEALDLGRNAFYIAMLASAPILLIGMVVGLLISIVQSVTQLQEQTLTFVPKIAAMVVAASFFTPWIARQLIDYTQALFSYAP